MDKLDIKMKADVIRLEVRGESMWDKYRHETKQTICIIGFLILAAKLCKADGHFNIQEEEEILKLIPHEPRQKRILMKILEEGGNDTKPIEYDAKKIKQLIGREHPDFLEFIVAALYKLAYVDDVYSEEEERDIRKIVAAFGLKKNLFDKVILKLNLAYTSFKGKKINA